MYINKIEKFLVEATLLDHTNNDAIDISKYINSIAVKKNYISESFPLFVINLMTTQIVRDKMRDNEISINLKVSKYTDSNAETTEDSAEQPVIDEVIIDTTIRIYEKEYNTSSQKIEDDNENEDNETTSLQIIPYVLVGIPDELVLKNAQVINEVYENAKMNDIMVNVLSSVEKTEIFIDSSDNNDREKSLVIPSLNVIPAIRYMQDTYGIYNSSLGIFFDLNKTYLYKIFNKNREYRNTFETIVVPANDIAEDQKFMTPLFDEENNVRLYLKIVPDFITNATVNYDTLGETTVFNSYDFDFDPIKRVYTNEEALNKKVRYYWNKNQNKLFEETFIDESIQIAEGTGISLSNVDPNYFSVDTLYTISTQNEYINGKYALIENSFMIFTSDYIHYNSLVHLKLTKIK